jgi:AcrR family transcriptional regulator
MAAVGRDAHRSADPRAQDTRRRLSTAFLALVATQPGSELSVAGIVAEAGLHRSSFSAHFDAIEELAAYAVDQHLAEIHAANLRRHRAATTASADSNLQVVREILAQARRARSFLQAVLEHDRALAEQAFGAALVARITDYYRAVPAYSALTVRRQSVSAEYVGHALSALVCAWLLGEVDLPEDDFVSGLSALLPAWILRPELVNA